MLSAKASHARVVGPLTGIQAMSPTAAIAGDGDEATRIAEFDGSNQGVTQVLPSRSRLPGDGWPSGKVYSVYHHLTRNNIATAAGSTWNGEQRGSGVGKPRAVNG